MTKYSWKPAGALLLSLSLLGGCVSQRHADDLQTLNRRGQEQLIDLQAQLDEANARIRALQNQQPRTTQDPQLLSQLERLQAERAQLTAALAQAEQALREASLQGPMLPAELDNALERLAESNPALMSYDPDLGMVKFHSDLTFALGSVTVSDPAKDSLSQLAEILKRPIAQGYEVRIVGHTDNVPIRRAETRSAHPTNWHLSAHRAIAVKDVLVESGVPSVRLGVAGHGEYRPVAANTASGNEQNRRVEIYLVPNIYRGPGLAAPAARQPQQTQSAQPRSQPQPAQQPETPAVFK